MTTIRFCVRCGQQLPEAKSAPCGWCGKVQPRESKPKQEELA